MIIETNIENLILTTDFTDEDIAYCLQRHKEIYTQEFGLNASFEDNLDELLTDFRDRFDPEKDFMLIAKDSDRFAGTISMIGEDDGKARLRFFFVEPFTRGKGVGKLLFTTAMKLSKQMGYTKAYFSTFNFLKIARTMYRNLGFYVKGEQSADEFGVGVIEEIWEKEL